MGSDEFDIRAKKFLVLYYKNFLSMCRLKLAEVFEV